MVTHACNLSNQEAEAGDHLKYEAILGYIGSSRPSSPRMRHRLKKKKQKTNKTKQQSSAGWVYRYGHQGYSGLPIANKYLLNEEKLTTTKMNYDIMLRIPGKDYVSDLRLECD